jgi:peroxiredoxin
MSLGRLFLLPVLLLAISLRASAAPPAVGQPAPNFTVTALDGSTLTLSTLTAKGSLLVVVLRGYPGYQCPFSQQIFQSYQQQAAQFAALGTQLLFVYPGNDGSNLANDAAGMIGSQPLASNVHVVLDPDYTLTNLYGVRWDGTDQTAYPATFVVNPSHSITFAHIGQLQSDFTPASNLLAFVHASVYPNSKP